MTDYVEFDFTDYHEHNQGAVGGFASENHVFRVYDDNKVEHDYDFVSGNGSPNGFDVDPDRLSTKKAALVFVEGQIADLQEKLTAAQELHTKLTAASSYKDTADYWWFEDEEDEEDEEPNIF